MDLWTILERAARLHPRRVALVDGARRATYPELRARCAALAAHLQRRGARPGDRLAVLAWNGQAFFESYFAAAGAGLVLVPLNLRERAEVLADVLRDAGARWLVADDELGELARAVAASDTPLEGLLWSGGAPRRGLAVAAERFEEVAAGPSVGFVRARPDPGDVAHLYYTSGTTGRPKGVMLTHRNVSVHALAAIGELGLGEDDRWAHVAPMFHLADAWATFAITWVGGTHVMLARFEPAAALDLCERERITLTNLVPTMLNRMVREPGAAERDWSSLRLVLSGGAPIAPEVVRAIVATFRCEYVQTYGMTETSPYLTLSLLKDHLRALPPEQQLLWCAKTGRPFAAVELRVVGDDGRDVAPDGRAVGEIWARGETVTPGYWNRPEETRAAFEDGWLKTGDLAVVDEEGYLDIVDRKKDVILTGGEKVYTTEVEAALYEHPAVLEAAVYGLADPIWGERVAAAVVLRPGAQAGAAELEAHCRGRLSAYKVPRELRLVAELPRTGSGKISKRALRGAP